MNSKTTMVLSSMVVLAAVMMFASGPVVGSHLAFAGGSGHYHHYHHDHHHHDHHDHHYHDHHHYHHDYHNRR